MKAGRTRKDHIRFAIIYEIVLLLLTAPVVSLVLDRPLEHVGALGLTLIFLSVVANYFYNRVFEFFRAKDAKHSVRGMYVLRVIHAIGLEVTLFVTALPLTMWFLDLSLGVAFLTEISVSAFAVVYTFVLVHRCATFWLCPLALPHEPLSDHQ